MTGKRDSSMGLSAGSLAELIRFLTSEAPCEQAPALAARAAVMLRELLRGPLPPSAAWVGHEAASVLDALTDEHADLETLKGLKDWAKELAKDTRTEPGHTVATAVYFCAIASALLYHGRVVTKYRPGELAKSFLRLGDALWLPEALRASLREACRRCQEAHS
jgi:hypothetical protein